MSKLSKRAITLFVIATMVLSILSAFIAVPVMADHTSTAIVAFTADASTVAGLSSSLDVVVTNGGPDPISKVTIDFTLTDFTGIGAGTPPGSWTGSVVAGVITYTGGTIVPATPVTFVPVVTNPETAGDATNPVVKTTDDGVKATLTTGATGVDEISYVADTPGVAGNLISIAYVDPGVPDSLLTVTVDVNAISVNLATDAGSVITSTAPQVVTEINIVASPAATLVDASSIETGLMVTGIGGALQFLSGGIDPIIYTAPVSGTLTILARESGFTIDQVSSDVVQYDDVLTVEGSGVTAGNTVKLYWDFATAGNELNTTTGLPSGEFKCEVTVPSAYYGNHYIWAIDAASGLPASWGPIHMGSSISISPDSELAGEPVDVSAYGFAAEEYVEIIIYNPTTPLVEFTAEKETNEDGHIVVEVTLPSTWDDGDYTIRCTDKTGKTATAPVTIGPALKLDVSVGPTGTVVKADGRGFNPLATITAETDIKLDGYAVDTKDGADIAVSSGGTFSVYIVIPSAPEGEYYVTFTDSGFTPPDPPVDPKTAKAKFEVDGETSIKVTPSYGTPGTTLTVKGYNFTRISGTDVFLTLMDQTAEATTDSSGSFTATITIPPLDFGVTYDVTAKDERNCEATDDVLVALMVLQLSAYSAPVGSEIMLMGSGLTINGWWNATFGEMDLIVDTQTSKDTTYFSCDFWVPSVPSGTYTIGVYDIGRDITVNIDFTVTDQAALSVSRAAIPNKYNLTIEGTNFVEKADVSTQWWIFNSTDAWNLNDKPNVTYGGPFVPTTSSEEDEEGTFTGYYKIPEFLELGSYTINCTTISNAAVDPDITQYAEVDIEIVPEEIVINIGSPSYARGQTITFVIKTTLKKVPFNLGIKDPEGSEYFNSSWIDEHWKTLGSWFYIPSNLQIDENTAWLYTLPTDAIPGTWTYSFWDEDKEYANGTFQVTHLTELEQLQVDIGELATGMEGIGTSIIDLATTVAGVSGASAEAVAAAAAAAAAAAEAQAAAEAGIAAIDDMSEISQDALDAANNAMSAADAAKDAADAGLAAANAAQATSQAAVDAAQTAAEAAEANQRQTSGLTTLVYGAIGASLIAALAAIVSLMQISRRIAG